MKSSSFLALGGAALFSAAIAFLPATAMACGDKDQACACGAACPSEHMGAGAAAEDGEKKAGACACGGAAAAGDAAAATGGEAAMGCNHAEAAAADAAHASAGATGAAQQQAVIDPETGKLTVPHKNAVVQGDIPPASVRNAAPASAQIAQPGGGVMAPFPADRASKVMAKVDETGAAHTGCTE